MAVIESFSRRDPRGGSRIRGCKDAVHGSATCASDSLTRGMLPRQGFLCHIGSFGTRASENGQDQFPRIASHMLPQPATQTIITHSQKCVPGPCDFDPDHSCHLDWGLTLQTSLIERHNHGSSRREYVVRVSSDACAVETPQRARVAYTQLYRHERQVKSLYHAAWRRLRPSGRPSVCRRLDERSFLVIMHAVNPVWTSTR